MKKQKKRKQKKKELKKMRKALKKGVAPEKVARQFSEDSKLPKKFYKKWLAKHKRNKKNKKDKKKRPQTTTPKAATPSVP